MSEEWKKSGDIWKSLMLLKQELISEFVKDLEEIRIQFIYKNNLLMIDKVLVKKEKWEEKL